MKKYNLLIAFIASVFLYSCDLPEPADSKTGEMLKGNHVLGKLLFHTADSVQSGSGLFKVVGESLVFSWKMKDGSFTTAQLPLSKIRVVFDPYCESAFIKFRWISDSEPDLTKIYDTKIVYAVITCKEEDFPKPNK